MRLTGCQFQGKHATEGHAHQGGTFQPVPVQKLGQVIHQVLEAETAAQREAILFAAKLIADDLKIAGQQTSQGAQQFKAASQPRNKNQRRPFPPDAILGCVVSEMGASGATFLRPKLGAA